MLIKLDFMLLYVWAHFTQTGRKVTVFFSFGQTIGLFNSVSVALIGIK